ncbi:MAG: M48 family metallopeptidase, partial [Alistipes sp.]|nr:M48 family metallopeptidase [Alistipes sp.]
SEQIEALRLKAKSYLPARLEELSQITGLKYNKVTIRAARTKWGSCTGQNNISLSLYLMTLPKHLIDYVLLHELCHTVHHNHSPKFHALLDKILGGKEKILAKELRLYSIP